MSSALRTAGPPHSQTAAARRSCTLVGPTAAAFCRRQCGARRRDHATRKCGFRSGETYRRLFRLVGDLYDTSGGPVGSSSGASQTPARRENPVPTRRPFCTRRVSGDAAMTSRWTPSRQSASSTPPAASWWTVADGRRRILRGKPLNRRRRAVSPVPGSALASAEPRNASTRPSPRSLPHRTPRVRLARACDRRSRVLARAVFASSSVRPSVAGGSGFARTDAPASATARP